MNGATRAAFVGMCLLAAAELVSAEVASRGLPQIEGLALRMAALTVLARAAAPLYRNIRLELELGGWAALLWVPLPILFLLANGRVAGITELLVVTLIPVGAIFAQSQSGVGFGQDAGGVGSLLPALIGFGGAALLLPYSLPASAAGRAWLMAMVAAALLAGLALFRVRSVARTVPLRPAIAAASSGIAFGAACFSQIGWTGSDRFAFTIEVLLVEATRLLLLDAPLLILTLFLLRRMPLAGYAARYLLVPLIAVVASFVLERPKLDWTLYTGAALILGASWHLLREPGRAAPAAAQEPG